MYAGWTIGEEVAPRVTAQQDMLETRSLVVRLLERGGTFGIPPIPPLLSPLLDIGYSRILQTGCRRHHVRRRQAELKTGGYIHEEYDHYHVKLFSRPEHRYRWGNELLTLTRPSVEIILNIQYMYC